MSIHTNKQKKVKKEIKKRRMVLILCDLWFIHLFITFLFLTFTYLWLPIYITILIISLFNYKLISWVNVNQRHFFLINAWAKSLISTQSLWFSVSSILISYKLSAKTVKFCSCQVLQNNAQNLKITFRKFLLNPLLGINSYFYINCLFHTDSLLRIKSVLYINCLSHTVSLLRINSFLYKNCRSHTDLIGSIADMKVSVWASALQRFLEQHKHLCIV